jgi:type II secretory pathway component PulL
VHQDFADYERFSSKLESDWAVSLHHFRSFISSISGSVTLKPFSFNYLTDLYQKRTD